MSEIRPATRADKAVWVPMRQALWPHSGDLEAELDNELARPEFKAWLAFDGPTAIGFAEASIRPYANGCDSKPVAFLEGIWIAETFRKQGIGKALVATVETWAKGQGIFELGSDTWLDDTRSQTVHGRWGFEETERVVYFRKKLKA